MASICRCSPYYPAQILNFGHTQLGFPCGGSSPTSVHAPGPPPPPPPVALGVPPPAPSPPADSDHLDGERLQLAHPWHLKAPTREPPPSTLCLRAASCYVVLAEPFWIFFDFFLFVVFFPRFIGNHTQLSSAHTRSTIKIITLTSSFCQESKKSQNMDLQNSSQNQEAVKTERDRRYHTN